MQDRTGIVLAFMPRSTLSLVDLKPEKRDMLKALAEQRQTIDAGLAACFLGKSGPETLAILDWLVRHGFLTAQADSRFSVNPGARAALGAIRRY